MPSRVRARVTSPRRVMPGRPLPDIPTLDVEERAFDLLRTDVDWRTKHLHFFLSDDTMPESGSRGLTLDKLDKDDTAPHGFGFAVEGDYKWGFGMDTATNNATGNADYVPAFDHTNGCDVIRLSLADDSTVGPLATKFSFGQRGGGPRAQTEAFLFAGGIIGSTSGDSLGGVRINYWSSGVAKFGLVLVNAHASNNNCLIDINDQFYFGTDLTGSGAQTLHIYDAVSAAERLRMDSSGWVRIGAGAPNSLLHVSGAVATAYSSKSGSYTVLATDSTFDVDATTAAVTLTLPTAVGISGREYTVKKIDNTVHPAIIDGAGSETIDGDLTLYLRRRNESRTIRSDGSNWRIVKAYIPPTSVGGIRSLLAFWAGGV